VAIKDLLVAYQGDKGSKTALEFALRMANKYGATVTGAHIHVTEQYASQVRAWIPEDVLERVRAAEQDVVKTIEASFRKTIKETAPKTPRAPRIRPANETRRPPRAVLQAIPPPP
jgi:nucleotide-binding universal stress UspA family protein